MDPLTVPARLERLGEIRRYVTEAAEHAGIGGEAAYNLSLAVDELATNIATHGYQESGLCGEIRVTAEEADGTLRIALEDTGVAFDPRSRLGPSAEDLAKPLEERPIGGLGIFLVLKSVDRFDYERVGQTNRNILEVRSSGH